MICVLKIKSLYLLQRVKTLKPWGDEELIMIPYSWHLAATNDEEYGVITVKYDDSL